MNIYSVTDAKAKFSQVVESVLQGEEVIVTKMGKPAVKISAYEAIARSLITFDEAIQSDANFTLKSSASIMTIASYFLAISPTSRDGDRVYA